MNRGPLVLITASLMVTASSAQVAPKPPDKTVPKLEVGVSILVCVDCEGRFEASTHEELLEGLAGNEFVGELRKALYIQDTIHQFSSKAHFDNCDFDGALAYLRELRADVKAAAAAAVAAKSRGDMDGAKAEARRAFYAIGQALHGVQDFYAHTNYVELTAPAVPVLKDVEVLHPWTVAGEQRIRSMQAQGLVSGYVFWGFPQRCATKSPSHSDLAKDSATTTSGRKVLAGSGKTQYEAARSLARKASVAFVHDVFTESPVLKELNGERLAFEVLVDRRGL